MTTKLTDILWNSYVTTIPTLKLKKNLDEDKDPNGLFNNIRIPYEFIIKPRFKGDTNYGISLFKEPLKISFESLTELEEAFDFSDTAPISMGGMKSAKTKKNKTRRKK
jgi:hypothetical protein